MFKKATYFIVVFVLLTWTTSCSNETRLTDDEIDYLQDNDSINVAVFPYYPPYQFINDQGKMDGIFVNYLNLIEKKIDYKFKKVYYENWANLINDSKNNKIDLILEIQHTKDKEDFLFFYPPLFESNNVIIQRKSDPILKGLKNTVDIKLILPNQYSIVEEIKRKYPNIIIGLGENDVDCLQKVSNGEYDAYIAPKAVTHYLINKYKFNNLSISTKIKLNYKPGIAVNKENKILQSIINKSFNAISNKEKRAILDNWLFNVITPFYEKSSFWIWVSFCFTCLLIIILFFNFYLKYIIKKRTIQLKDAKEKAEESDRLKTVFIQNISHEIRTPMNGIIGFSELIIKENLSLEEQKEYVKIIANNSKDLIVIIDNILEIAKLQTERISVRPEEIDLDALFENIYKKYLLKTKEKNINFVVESKQDKAFEHVLIDKPKLFKILLNLIDNAIKFTQMGSVIIQYEIIQYEIVISIKDSGIGIQKKDQETIFHSFSQSEKEISKNHGGLGLGLSIAKKNADLIGGKITFTTQENQGSTFILTIPYIPIPVNENITNKNNLKNIDKPEKHIILIAEDGDVNFLFLKAILTKMPEFDFIIHRAENGRKAVDICEENTNIELVLMDIKMPIMDGYEATKRIKKLRPHLPIVAQTAYSTEEDIKKAIDAGCDDFISKPVDRSLLKPILSRYIYKSSL